MLSKIMKTLKEYIFEAIGQASMCWNPRPSTEVFNSEEAKNIANELLKTINDIIKQEEKEGDDRKMFAKRQGICEGMLVAKKIIKESETYNFNSLKMIDLEIKKYK